jgi:hypothetical protein
VYWLIEGKSDHNVSRGEMEAKRATAEEWVAFVNDNGRFGTWRCLFCSEIAIKKAHGGWDGLLVAARTHIAVEPTRGTRRSRSARRRLGDDRIVGAPLQRTFAQSVPWLDVKRRFMRRWCTASLSRRGSHALRRANGPGCVR